MVEMDRRRAEPTSSTITKALVKWEETASIRSSLPNYRRMYAQRKKTSTGIHKTPDEGKMRSQNSNAQ